MNERYDYRMLEDPEDALGDLNDPAELLMIINQDLPQRDLVAYAFMDALTLDEEQISDLESIIDEAGVPMDGDRQWAQDNNEIVQPWLDAARNAQEES
jgi:glycine betaine/proline transport system substrate-binding protein